MGYDLHIHRRKWWHEDGNDIALSEWKAVCDADLSLEMTGKATATVPQTGAVIELESEGMTLWTGKRPKKFVFLKGNAPSTWFDFNRGAITTSGANVAIIAKACEIAEALAARVQGDEGEFYRPDGSYYNEDD
jgi:hypothetical protein